MSGLWVADSTGTYQKAKKIWVADATGTYAVAKTMGASDTTGTYKTVQVASEFAGGTTYGLVASQTSEPWRSVALSWPAQGSGTTYKVLDAGNPSTVLYTGTGTSFVHSNLEPGKTYSYVLEVGTSRAAQSVSFTTTTMPAPRNATLAGVNPDAYRITFEPVAGATGYEKINYSHYATPTVDFYQAANDTLNEGIHVVGPPRGYHDVAVRAVYGINRLPGAVSNHVIFTVPNPVAAVPFGDYFYRAVGASTFQSSPRQWRPDSDGLYHGNGSQWGSTRGLQSAWFFYGHERVLPLRGGRVVRFRVFMARTDDAGSSTAQTYQWRLHSHGGKPGDPFTGVAQSHITDAGALARGQSAWIDLPVEWGQRLVNGEYQGIACGHVDGRYMRHNPLSQQPANGEICLTIG